MRNIDQPFYKNQQWWAVFSLWMLVLISSLSVIYSAYDTRNKFNQLQKLYAEQNLYQVEWSQYLLEESAWASYGRIESVAKKELSMSVPTIEQMIVVSSHE